MRRITQKPNSKSIGLRTRPNKIYTKSSCMQLFLKHIYTNDIYYVIVESLLKIVEPRYHQDSLGSNNS